MVELNKIERMFGVGMKWKELTRKQKSQYQDSARKKKLRELKSKGLNPKARPFIPTKK